MEWQASAAFVPTRVLLEEGLREDLGGVQSQVVDGAEGEQGRDVLLDLKVFSQMNNLMCNE